VSAPTHMDAVTSELRGLGVPLDLRRYPSLDSTNDTAAELAWGGAPEGLVVLAEEQRVGRGRFARTWVSPAGGNLYLSALLRLGTPTEPPAALGSLNLVTSLAVLDAVAGFLGSDPREPGPSLKWPNDLVHGSRKLCGVLSRLGTGPQGELFVVVGVGVNVNVDPKRLVPQATSLATLCGGRVDREALLAELLRGFYGRVATWRREGPAGQVAEWLERSRWQGRRVRVSFGGGDPARPRPEDAPVPVETLEGRVLGLRSDGALEIRPLGSGPDQVVLAGDASLESVHGD
jgi:BirA family transcriptional regulator, biotin operon repressor / biotin---[acetyl-CoA-carboxylase] ligase